MKKQFFFFLSAIILLVTATGCQDAIDVVSPDLNYKANTDISATITPNVSLKLPTVINADEPFTAEIDADGAKGTLQLQILIEKDNPATPIIEEVWETISAAECVTNATLIHNGLPAGEYVFRASFAPSDCSYENKYEVSQSEREIRTISSVCSGLTLEAVVGYEGQIVSGQSKEFTITFTVDACDQDYNNLKLQGGLVAWIEGTPVAPGAATIQLNQNNNYKIIWEIGNQTAGFNNTYTVTYNYTPNGNPGTIVNITGGWSVVGYTQDGTEVTFGIDPVTITIPTVEFFMTR